VREKIMVTKSDVLAQAARQCGVSPETLTEWIQEQLIPLHDDQWDDEAIETARRIRRLTALGVNLAGVEIVLYMRQEIMRHQAEAMRFQEEMEQIRTSYEQKLRELMRQLSDW
jgi:DNA-binding transcriptional MerR regulator